MNNTTLLPPCDFTNPYESNIIKLEKKLSQGTAGGGVFAELKEIKNLIRVLKSELHLTRGSTGKQAK